jgi:hypothetical protein
MSSTMTHLFPTQHLDGHMARPVASTMTWRLSLFPTLLILFPLLGVGSLSAAEGNEEDEEETQVLGSQARVIVPPTPRVREVTFTATPASAGIHWPDDWSEGGPTHRAEVAALEGNPAPALIVDLWEGAGAVDLADLGDKVVVLVFWAPWREASLGQIGTLARAVEERRRLGARLVLIRSEDASRDPEGALGGVWENVHSGVDSSGTTRAAYGVDSFPDYHLIADGHLLCADVANDHILQVLDAALQGWRP